MAPPTVDQLHTFHAQERQVFSKLVLQFSKPPAESLLVMATWLWLENFGFENIFSILTALTDPFILALANEAISCFCCLDSKNPPNNFNQIPLTATLMRKDISLLTIYTHRYSAIVGIKNFLTSICSRVFTDILQRALPSSSSSSFVPRFRRPLVIPGFPHPTFGSINVIPNIVVGNNIPINNFFLVPNGIWGWNINCIANQNDRTMFITFSRGFPVSSAEVVTLFTRKYGENCVQSVYMPNDNENANNNDQQPLFARLVLDSVTTVDCVLKGANIRKFRINGKHIWARKYAHRECQTK